MLQHLAFDDPDPPRVYSNGDGFGASIHESADGAVVSVAGEIDVATAALFERVIQDARRLRRRVIIDMADTTFMDSSGLAVLLNAHRDLGQLPEALALRSVNARVLQLLRISGADQLLTLLPGPT